MDLRNCNTTEAIRVVDTMVSTLVRMHCDAHALWSPRVERVRKPYRPWLLQTRVQLTDGREAVFGITIKPAEQGNYAVCLEAHGAGAQKTFQKLKEKEGLV